MELKEQLSLLSISKFYYPCLLSTTLKLDVWIVVQKETWIEHANFNFDVYIVLQLLYNCLGSFCS